MSSVEQSILPAGPGMPPGVAALTTLRSPAGQSSAPYDGFNLGDHCGDTPADVAANREALRLELDLPATPRWLRQIHGTTVIRFEDGGPTAWGGADASVTSERGVVLAVLTADCLPLVLAAKDASEVAVAHAGWRGLAAGIIEATVQAMRTPPRRLIAWLGPAAGPGHYEVGMEVWRAFVDDDPGAAGAFAPTRYQHWHVDLFALARRRLSHLGVEKVRGGGECTISDPGRFFSHRRDGVTGRMATLAYLQ